MVFVVHGRKLIVSLFTKINATEPFKGLELHKANIQIILRVSNI